MRAAARGNWEPRSGVGSFLPTTESEKGPKGKWKKYILEDKEWVEGQYYRIAV